MVWFGKALSTMETVRHTLTLTQTQTHTLFPPFLHTVVPLEHKPWCVDGQNLLSHYLHSQLDATNKGASMAVEPIHNTAHIWFPSPLHLEAVFTRVLYLRGFAREKACPQVSEVPGAEPWGTARTPQENLLLY